MSDSDWLRENGYEDLVKHGSVPKEWNEEHKRMLEGASLYDSEEDLEATLFRTFDEAKKWSQSNGGKAFTRSPHGDGFIPKRK